MSRWRPTPAHARAWFVTTLGVVVAVGFGRPLVLVILAPFALLAVLGEAHRPRGEPPAPRALLDHHVLREGRGTTARVRLTGDTADVEHVVAVRPAARHLSGPRVGSGLLRDGPPVLQVGAEHWGEYDLGTVTTALTASWGGYRAGPAGTPAGRLTVLPQPVPYDAQASAPHPLGMVGAHQSLRSGDGLEYAATRPFVLGDKLRRVNWRQTARTGDLHVDTTLTQEDTEVTLVVDALAELRPAAASGESSLDLAVRAAAAIGEHHLRAGDRVALRVVSGTPRRLPLGAGGRHRQRLLAELARVRPSDVRTRDGHTRLGIATGGVAVILTPMLHPRIAGLAATLLRSGVSALVVDTLPAGTLRATSRSTDPTIAELAWRMRRLERLSMLDRLELTGCPVVPWHGPGTLDEVLRRLNRRSRTPRLRAR